MMRRALAALALYLAATSAAPAAEVRVFAAGTQVQRIIDQLGIAAVGPVESATAELLDFLASPVAVEAFRRIGFAR